MPSTATTRLRLEKQATGDSNNTWGTKLNSSVFDLVDAAISGMASYTLSGTKTLTSTNYAADEARMPFQNITGGTGGTVTVPSVEGRWFFRNGASGDVIVTTGSGATATIKSGDVAGTVCDGTNVYLVRVIDYGSSLPKSSGTPSTNSELTPKGYVDAAIASAAFGSITLGSGVQTWLQTPTTANFAAAVTGETGTGAVMFGTAPTLSAPTITGGGSWAGSPTIATPTMTTPAITAGGSWAGSPTISTPSISGPTITSGGSWAGGPTISGGASLTGGPSLSAAVLSADSTVNDTGTIAATSAGFRGIPQNAKTGAYQLVVTDNGKSIPITAGGITIPANASVAFPLGATLVIYNDSGTSQTVAITTDTLRLAGSTSTGSRTLANYGLATLFKANSTTWVISGAGVS